MIRHIITGVMMACAALSAAHAQDNTPPQNVALQKQEIAKGEPARWSQPDSTKAEQERTLRKEIGAALAEAKQACQKGPSTERSTCLKAAQATYQNDLANLPQLLAKSH
jgi:hypothetical protein